MFTDLSGAGSPPAFGTQTRTLLERFRVTAPLATGGMGTLCLADDLADDLADVAGGAGAVLKILRGDVAHDGQAAARFEHEIVTLRRLRHPLIPAWLADGSVDGERAFALRHVDGVSIAEIMASAVPVPPVVTLGVGIDLLCALAHVHGAVDEDGRALGLVHRDVSPHNVIVDEDGRAHLIDFGVSADALFPDREDGVLIGKIAYMAPEQACGFFVDDRADQFSAGVVVWELLTGQRLFRSSSDRETWRRVLACVVSDVSAWVEVAPAVAAAVARMLRPNRNDRFASCAAAAAALALCLVDAADRDAADADDNAAVFGAARATRGTADSPLRRPTTTLRLPLPELW